MSRSKKRLNYSVNTINCQNNAQTIEKIVIYEQAEFKEPFTTDITVKLTPTQNEQIRKIAQIEGKGVSTFIRDCISYKLANYRMMNGG